MIVSFFLIEDKNLYGGGVYRSLVFFLFMLFGAIMGKHTDRFICKWWHLPTLIIATALWFFVVHTLNSSTLIFSIIPLFYILYSLYCVCNARVLTKIYNTPVVGGVMYIISQLCLEVYLIQKFIFTDKFNYLFPFNIIAIMLVVIIAAYFVKIFAEFISQTFRTEPYEWKKMLLYRR